LCMKPDTQSSRIPASTRGTPVSPRCHARSMEGLSRGQGKAS
jgi:hypothetical protein